MKKTLCVLVLTFAVVAPALADDPKTIAQRLEKQYPEYNVNESADVVQLRGRDTRAYRGRHRVQRSPHNATDSL